MTQVWHFLKLAVSVVAGVAAAVCVFVAMPLATPLALVSIAFSLMPE